MTQQFRVASLLLVAGLLVGACQASAPPASRASDRAPAPASAPQAQAAGSAGATAPAGGPTRVTVAVTETIESQNPYADSVSLLYGIWCEVLGCLVTWDPRSGEYAPALAASWSVESPTSWIFNLRRDARWQDGAPFTAADVLHSFDRIANDPGTKQKSNIAPVVERVEAIDEHTVRIVTKGAVAPLLDYFKDLLIMSSKAQYDRHGEDVWREKPLGTGPYMFKELVPNQRMVIEKNPNWWGGPVEGPDEVVYRVMREPEVRVTALLNGEVQLAMFIPPHLADRVSASPNTKIAPVDSLEIMFLAMMPRSKPWENKLVRQAVAYAIDRDGIIQGLLQGYASRLDGPIGPGQYGYNPDLQPKYTYNPEKAKQLLAQAGYPNG